MSRVGEAREGGFDKTRGAEGGFGRGHGAWRRHRRAAANGVREGETEERERDGFDGNFVNNTKFKTPVCKLNFYPSTWPQMKNS